jgi:hypothetical protein
VSVFGQVGGRTIISSAYRSPLEERIGFSLMPDVASVNAGRPAAGSTTWMSTCTYGETTSCQVVVGAPKCVVICASIASTSAGSPWDSSAGDDSTWR